MAERTPWCQKGQHAFCTAEESECMCGCHHGVNHDFIHRFKEEHGHPPWTMCGEPPYACLKESEWTTRPKN